MRLLAAPMNGATIWAFATLPMTLPEGRYAFDFDGKLPASRTVQDWMLGWALASYRFTRYRAPKRGPATILWPEAVERGDVDPLTRAVERGDVDPLTRAVERTRDLINMPADDMGPQELEDAVHGIAAETGASVRRFAGAGLLENDFPAIHMVGRASNRAPRLIDLTWRMATDPRVTLVGKGVCFDTGGLDIKAHDPMLEMKKDMGGAAIMLGLAGALMAANLPIWRDYRPQISGTISDLANVAKGNFGGAIIAAMFLAEFVSRARLWMHVDIYAANASSRPGRPEGGEATGLRALYAFIRERYGARPPKAAR